MRDILKQEIVSTTTLRRIGLVLAVAVAVVLASLTIVRIERSRDLERAADRFEQTVGPLEFEAYAPGSVPDADNAAVPILEALGRLEERAGETAWREQIGPLGRQNRSFVASWSDEDVRRARALVGSRAEVLELLHAAVGRSGSSFGLDYSAGPTMEIPNLLMALQAGNLLLARARLGWLDGSPDGAVRSVETLAALSRALQAEAPLIFQLVGHAVEGFQHRAIRDGLATGALDLEALRRLRETVEERSRAEGLRRSLGIEGTLLYLARPGGPLAGSLFGDPESLDRLAGPLVDWERWLGGLTYRWLGHGSVARGLAYYVRVLRVFPDLPHAEMLDRPELLTPPPNDLTRLVVDLEGVTGNLAVSASLTQLSRLALDAALVGAETGSLPAELPATPAVDPFTGNRPTYLRAVDGSAILSIPGADALWGELEGSFGRGVDGAELFEWRLPGPSAKGG